MSVLHGMARLMQITAAVSVAPALPASLATVQMPLLLFSVSNPFKTSSNGLMISSSFTIPKSACPQVNTFSLMMPHSSGQLRSILAGLGPQKNSTTFSHSLSILVLNGTLVPKQCASLRTRRKNILNTLKAGLQEQKCLLMIAPF